MSYDGITGNVTIVADLSRDFRNGRLYPGGFSICPTDKTMFIGIDADDGEFSDFIVEYEYFTPGAPHFVGAKPLLLALQALELGAHQVWHVGDSAADEQAAQAAGIHCVLVKRP